MRNALVFSAILAALASGIVTMAAAGGDGRDVHAANLRTAKASSVHYVVAVRLTKDGVPMRLRIAGGSSRDALAVRLALAAMRLEDGTALPGTNAAIRLSKPFLYESAPNGMQVFGNVRWLRLHVLNLPERSETLSTVRSLTPAPLLRIVAESKLRAGGKPGWFAGRPAYDDPVVRTALNALGGGIEFRDLRIAVRLGADGLVHGIRLTGRTADRKAALSVRARLYSFGKPVTVVPPKPGTFMDPRLSTLES